MCKLEKYGNCDEETKDQGYCIFHKPRKNKREAKEFYEKFLEKFKPLKINKIVLGERRTVIIFEKDIDCRGYVFPEATEDAQFSFTNSIFKGRADFQHTTFEGNVDFQHAVFKLGADFFNATFEKEANFGFTTFEQAAEFARAVFKEVAIFGMVAFKGMAIFKDTVFKGPVFFFAATFNELAIFNGKREEAEYKFYHTLNFSNAEFRKGIDIDLPSEWFKLPEAEAEACRVQRISYEKEGRREHADRMFVRERRALRRDKVRKAKEELSKSKGIKLKLRAGFKLIKAGGSFVLEFLLADSTCSYGTEWKKTVILWLLYVIILFPFLYWISNSVKVDSIFDYFYFSIVTATTLGYGDLHPIGIGKVLASIEAVFGTFMWAVFLAVFARKYMR